MTDRRLKKRSKKSKWTNRRLFNKIIEKLGEKGVFPEILDYTLPEYESIEIDTYEFDVVGCLNHGGSEGVYVDMYLKGEETIRLGTFKTLKEDYESWGIMAKLMADFQWECERFIQEHLNEFDGVA